MSISASNHFGGVGFHRGLWTGVDVSVDEVLKDQLWVFEIAGVVIIGLSVDFLKSLSQVFLPPDEFFQIWMIIMFTFVL